MLGVGVYKIQQNAEPDEPKQLAEQRGQVKASSRTNNRSSGNERRIRRKQASKNEQPPNNNQS